jgi:hypothetical protein
MLGRQSGRAGQGGPDERAATAGRKSGRARSKTGPSPVGLFNRGPEEAPVAVDFRNVSVSPARTAVRDIWAQKDLGARDRQVLDNGAEAWSGVRADPIVLP